MSGDVEVFAEGEDADIMTFIEMLRQGPSMSMVMDMDISDYPFENRYTKFFVDME